MEREEKKQIKRLLAWIALILIAALLVYCAYAVFFDEGIDVGSKAIGFFGLLIVGPVLLWLCIWSAKIIVKKGEENRQEMEEAVRRMQETEEDVPQ